MGGGNLGVESKDLWPTTFDFETFLEQDLWPAASTSPSPEFEPTLEAAATLLTLLEQVFIALGTVLHVLRDQDCVTGDFLLMAAPHVLDVVLPV